MPKVTARAAVLTAVLLAALTGCAGTPESAPSEPEQASESAAPLVAETQQSESDDDLTAEETFLKHVREELPEDTVIPDATDQQLLAAAEDACEQIASGVDVLAVQVIEGETANDLGYYESSAKIGGLAAEFICP